MLKFAHRRQALPSDFYISVKILLPVMIAMCILHHILNHNFLKLFWLYYNNQQESMNIRVEWSYYDLVTYLMFSSPFCTDEH